MRRPTVAQWLRVESGLLAAEYAAAALREGRVVALAQVLRSLGVTAEEVRGLVDPEVHRRLNRRLGPARPRRPRTGRAASPRPPAEGTEPVPPATMETPPRSGWDLDAALASLGTDRQRAVLRIVTERALANPDALITPAQAAAQLQSHGEVAHKEGVRKTLDRLVALGLVAHPTPGRYRLAEQAKGPLKTRRGAGTPETGG